MYNILISTVLAILIFVLLAFGLHLFWWLALIIAILLMSGSFILISRIIMKRIEAIMSSAMKDIQTQRTNSKEMQVKLVEKAISEMRGALKYGKWQIYVTGQINSSIGMLYYIKRDFTNAFPYLQKGFFKNWITMGMLAVTYMKKNKKDKMRATFDRAVIGSPKESLIWALYAFCLNSSNDKDKAIEILNKGLKKLPGDEKLADNLELLKDGKKMKMTDYGEMWYQFHLENTGTIQKQQMAAMTGGMKRKVVKR